MSAPVDGPLDQWLGYRDSLPLRLAALAQPPSQAELAHWQEQNLRVLQAIAVLDERHPRADAADALEAEVERLHQKLDLVLEMLAGALRGSRGGAPLRPLRISREGLSWPAAVTPPPAEPAALLLASVELHGCAPGPLCWPVQLIGMHGDEHCGRFLPMHETLAAALERFVFTRHRRSVAGARSPETHAAASGTPRQ